MRHRTRFLGILVASLAIFATWPMPAEAQRRPVRPARPGVVVFVGGYFYDPFYGPYPWWTPAAYTWGYHPVFDDRAQVRVIVKPRDAAVYVDGYYAGIVDEFDGVLQRLPLTPGPHEIVVHLEGFRTISQRLYLGPSSQSSLRLTLERLAPGERSEPPSLAPPLPPPPAGTARLPRRPPPGSVPTPRAPQPSDLATLAIRVQPVDAEVFIDGECWSGSTPGDRLLVHVPSGTHRVEIQKDGYRRFTTEIQLPAGETAAVNVSLSPEGTR